jgi:hypothetical protein
LLLNDVETYSGGAGTFNLTVELANNYTGAERAALIAIADGAARTTFRIVQRGRPIPQDPAEMTGVNIGGVIWATRDVGMPGRFTDELIDDGRGMYYKWNSRVGWNMLRINSNEEGNFPAFLPEDSEVWENENDPCPEGWRIPTSIEASLLAGEREKIYLSFSGWIRHNGTFENILTSGRYWLRENSSSEHNKQSFTVLPGGVFFLDNAYRFDARSIRCVKVSEYIITH